MNSSIVWLDRRAACENGNRFVVSLRFHEQAT
jgi:hypothetical protein